jgi:hypothetical protein
MALARRSDDKREIPMFALTLRAALAGALLLPLSLHADTFMPQTGDDFIASQRKIQCSTIDGKEETFVWRGAAYARVQGMPDKHLFDLLGMNVRACGTVTDPQQGTGYRLVSREIMLYLDPQTGEVLRTMTNPYTGQEVEVLHVANDPVNGRPTYARRADGSEQSFAPHVYGDIWQNPITFPLFYHNELGGDYQKYVGGTYHATEMFDFAGSVSELLDPAVDSAKVQIAWVRLAQWLPWLEMQGREGLMYFNAMGVKLDSWDELPELMKREIAANYPQYTNAPPLNDTRPNDTSWTYFKKVIEARKARDAASR